MSKHGSGQNRYGRTHHAPYEPDTYVEWARRDGMRAFLGNLEDPRIPPRFEADGFVTYPAAFWLEPHWRDTRVFTIPWLIHAAETRDVVLLLHPENVTTRLDLMNQFTTLITHTQTGLLT